MDQQKEPRTPETEDRKRPLHSRLYDKLPVTVAMMDKIIIGVAALILILILVGILT